MENNLYNNYLFKAIKNYPWELEIAVEVLNYALSYEPENPKALWLMAKVQSEQLGDYNMAKRYYEKALASRIDFPDIYPDYIHLLINYDDYEEAQVLIDFAKQLKGIDKAGIQLAQAYLYEAINEFEKAENALKKAKQLALNNDFITYADDALTRVSKKRKAAQKEERKIENTQKIVTKETDKNWFRNRLNNLL